MAARLHRLDPEAAHGTSAGLRAQCKIRVDYEL
jgi:hypothetical protein